MTVLRHRAASTRTRWTRGAAAFMSLTLLSSIAVTACGAARPAGQGDEQRAIAESDLARDALQRGRLREALGHTEKALELDEDNADAAYLEAIVLLGFCASDVRSTDCRFERAEKMARKALAVSPEMRDAKN